MTANEPLVDDLLRPANLPGRPGRVELRTTHGSWVFLTGDGAAYKVKRPKDYGFLDYRTLAARERMCAEEVRLNRRGAPGVYLGVLPVTRDAGGCSLVRPGEIVDWAVHMRRLPDERSALGLLRAGKLGPGELDVVARFAARYYAAAEPHPPDPAALRANCEESFAQLASMPADLLDRAQIVELVDLQQRWLAEHAPALARRPCRDGHGDLRLEHVYLLDEGPVLLDCIEFLARFRIADPALDAAFLAMDLTRYGRRDLAESWVARFAAHTGDYDLYPLLDGYVSYRAAVRAKVAGFVASDPASAPEVIARKRAEARAQLALAREVLLRPPRQPRLIAVAGIIASGKSTVAERLARAWHAPVVGADTTRKQLAGIEPQARGGPELYTEEFDRRVHGELLRRVALVLSSGRCAILDTTLRSRAVRDRVRALARRFQAPFTLVECKVSEAEARTRLRARTGGVSDAREELLPGFLARFCPIVEVPAAEHVVLDTSRPAEEQERVLRAGFAMPP